MDQALAKEEQTNEIAPEVISQQEEAAATARRFCLSWRRFIFDGSRVAFIICSIVFVHAASSFIEELRLLRTEVVEQSTAIRMAIQLQGREINKNLHLIYLNSSVLIDRFDTQTTHLRGQMNNVATAAAIASKEERKQIVNAIQSNSETQKEVPAPVVVPEVRIVPVPEIVPMEQPKVPEQQQVQPVPQTSPAPVPAVPEGQRKGNLFKRLWSPFRRIF